jgi:hypothetical protein
MAHDDGRRRNRRSRGGAVARTKREMPPGGVGACLPWQAEPYVSRPLRSPAPGPNGRAVCDGLAIHFAPLGGRGCVASAGRTSEGWSRARVAAQRLCDALPGARSPHRTRRAGGHSRARCPSSRSSRGALTSESAASQAQPPRGAKWIASCDGSTNRPCLVSSALSSWLKFGMLPHGTNWTSQGGVGVDRRGA